MSGTRVLKPVQLKRRPHVTGVGLGLRFSFLDDVLAAARGETAPLAVDFFEVAPENYMRRGGYVPAALEKIRERYPLFVHGLTLSIGGTDPFADSYLLALEAFLKNVEPEGYSDHLCFGSEGGRLTHELLPLPFWQETVLHVAARAREVHDRVGQRLALENISYYFVPGAAELSELDFLRAVLDEGDVELLLDLNNIVVNAKNFGFDALEFLHALPLERVVGVHIAGHEYRADQARFIDTHGSEPDPQALVLLEDLIARTGPLPVVLERDSHIPQLPALLQDVQRVREAYQRGLAKAAT